MQPSTIRHCLELAFAVTLSTGWVAQAEEGLPPLVISGENTVILPQGEHYAQSYLQYFLMKYVARHPEAEKYRPRAKLRPDRAAAPVFPIVKQIPQGKNAIVHGLMPSIRDQYLLAEDKERLRKARTGSALLKRNGNIVVLALRDGISSNWNFSHIRLFLDILAGVRQYAPDGADGLEWVSYSKSPQITIGTLDLLKQPYFAKGTFSSGGHERWGEWARLNSVLAEGANIRANHGITAYFSPDKYYDQHPQLYPMDKSGKRPRPKGGAWNPCFADPDLAAHIAMDEIRVMKKARPRRKVFSFGVMDCAYDCRCPVCMAEPNKANLWYAVLNEVARQCQEEFPGTYLTSYHYINVGTPTKLRVEPNIVFDYTCKSYNWVDERWAAGEKAEIMEIASVGASWVLHDWNFSGVTPRIYSHQVAAFLQWGAQNGMLGMYTEWHGGESWYLEGAKYWVLRQLLSDPYQDVDALWRKYCRDMFGPAWEEMYRFYRMFADKHVCSDKWCRRADCPRQEMICFTPEDLALQRRWLERATELTQDDEQIQKRLAIIMRYFRAHELFALATGVPGRLHHQFRVLEDRDGVNREALAFYVNEEGNRLQQALDYYQNERTREPDLWDGDYGIVASYINNYTRAMADIVLAIRRQALKGVNFTTVDGEKVQGIVAASKRILRENLPKTYKPGKLALFDGIMGKTLWIPTLAELPKIDGHLSDAGWRQAVRLTGFTIRDTLASSKHKSEGRLMRVGDHLVLGLTFRQDGGLYAATTPDVHKGTRIWRESGVEVFFGPVPAEGEEQQKAQYIINALGASRGFGPADGNRQGVHVAVQLDKGKGEYVVEAALPLKAEGYDYAGEKALSFNLMRNVFLKNSFHAIEIIGWHPIFATAHDLVSRGLVFME